MTSHVERENQPIESKPNVLEKTFMFANNNQKLLVGPSFSGKTYFMLENFSRKPNRDVYLISKSLPEPYSNSRIKVKETGELFKALREYENAIIVFDDILGLSNSSYKDQFFVGGRHNILEFFLSITCLF